jgi:hypothetical protein
MLEISEQVLCLIGNPISSGEDQIAHSQQSYLIPGPGIIFHAVMILCIVYAYLYSIVTEPLDVRISPLALYCLSTHAKTKNPKHIQTITYRIIISPISDTMAGPSHTVLI